MSKKTNAVKQKARTTKPRRRAHVRKGRPNPAFGKIPTQSGDLIFGDPIFLHHVASAILRFLEIRHPAELAVQRGLNSAEDSKVDAEFVARSCKYCGKTPADAYEESMGMFCPGSPNNMHVMEPTQ